MQPAAVVGPPSHEVTLQRFKLLHLVQQVAKADVDELIRTVGIEALTFRGTGMRRALAEAGGGMGINPSPNAQHHTGHPYVEQREHHRHVYREFSGGRPHQTLRPVARQAPAEYHGARSRYDHNNDGAAYAASDSYSRPQQRGDYYSSVALEARAEGDYHRANDQHRAPAHRRGPPRQQEVEHDRRHLVSTPERARPNPPRVHSGPPPPSGPNPDMNRGSTLAHHREQVRGMPQRDTGNVAEVPHKSAQQHATEQDVPPHAEMATCAVPKEIIQLAGQILARTTGRASRGGSLQATPQKGAQSPQTRTQSVAVEAQLRADATSVGVGSPTDMARTSGNALPQPHADRRDVATGGNVRALRMEDAAVSAAAPQSSVATNTPPPKRASTITQTRNDVLSSVSVSRPSTAEHGTGTGTVAPTLRLSEATETDTAWDHARGTHFQLEQRHGQPPRWAVDALHALDTILEEQSLIEARANKQQARREDVALEGGNAMTQDRSADRRGEDAADADTRHQLDIARTARRVDAMMDEEEALGQATRLQNPQPSNDGSSNIAAAARRNIRRAQRQPLPPSVVEKLLAFRTDEVECIRYNERLWNTSNVSQFTFANRLTSSLLEDLFDEVIQEVGGVLDEYVDGLADHELQ